MRRQKTQIAVVGAGAAGLCAAIAAAENGGRVLLIDGNKEVGRKIPATGNGKCNFTNTDIAAGFYHGADEEFVESVLSDHGTAWALEYFSDRGVFPRVKRDCVYPNSGAASDIRDCLKAEIDRLGVECLFDCRIHKITKNKTGYRVFGNRAFKSEAVNIDCRSVILAPGGMAAPHTGSDGEGFGIAASLGHRLIHPLPALVALKCNEDYFKGLSSIRVNGRISVLVDKEVKASDEGELQLREDGISGIPVFQVSYAALRGLYEQKQVSAAIDFFPEMSSDELEEALARRLLNNGWGKNGREALLGFLPTGVLEMIFCFCNLEYFDDASSYTPGEIRKLAGAMKGLCVTILGSRGFDAAQTTSGGVCCSEISPETMESRKYKGLFFAGEIMDVDGICGGYNLHWAFSTGDIAGRAAADYVKQI